MTVDMTPAPAMSIVELGHTLNEATPHGPGAPRFEHRLLTPHVPFTGPDTAIEAGTITSATDAIAVGSHTGTHLDSLTHVAVAGRAGTPAPDLPQPIIARGVLLDFPAFWGCEVIPSQTQLTPQDLDSCARWAGLAIGAGDAVLIRTGWDTIAGDPERFCALPIPGPELAAARYLTGLGVSVVGSDTMPFEAAPGQTPLAVHAELIVNHRIQILEMLDLRQLSARRGYEFTLVVAPLRIANGTGSPVNPLAILTASPAADARPSQ